MHARAPPQRAAQAARTLPETKNVASAPVKQVDHLALLMKVAKARRAGTLIVGGNKQTSASTRDRMCTFLMARYFLKIFGGSGDVDAARDTIATTITRVIEDAKKFVRAIPAATSHTPATKRQMNVCIVFAMVELTDLATIFVREKAYP